MFCLNMSNTLISQDERFALLQHADSLAAKSKLKEATETYKLILASTLEDSITMVSYVRLAQIYIFDIPEPDTSKYYLDELNQLCNKTTDSRCYILHNSIHNFLSKQKQDFVSAIVYSEDALKYLDSSTKDLWFNVYTNYANTFENLGEFKLARENYIKAFQGNYPISQGDSLLAWINISSTFRENPDSIIYYSNKGIEICENQMQNQSCQMLYNNLTWALAEKEEYETALSLVQKHLTDANKYANRTIEFSPALNHTTGYIHLKLGNTEEAISYFNLSLPEARKTYNIPLIIRNLKDLSAAYFDLNKIEKSRSYLIEQLEYADILHQKEIKSEIIRYENSKSFQEMNTKIQSLEEESTEITGINKRLRIGIIGLLILCGVAGLFIYLRQQLNKIRISKLNEEISVAKLGSLSATMNPHFIFNAFNTLQNFILKNEQDKAEGYLAKLSGLLRNILSYTDDISIPLNKEIDLLQAYFQLEKERFQNSVVFKLDVDVKLNKFNPRIPAMILQPHLENAIHHGFTNVDTNGVINLSIKKEGEYISCTLIDNGIGRQKSSQIKQKSKHNSIATSNTKNRIDLLKKLGYKQSNMNIIDVKKDNAATGTEIHLFLPLFLKSK